MNNVRSDHYGLCLLMFLAVYSLSGWSDEVSRDFNAMDTQEASIDQLLLKGQSLLDEGHLDEAVAVFDRVLVHEPENDQAIYQKGVVLTRKKEYEQGVALIEQAVELAPDNVVYQVALASMYEFSGRLLEALAMYKRIVSSVDSNSDYLVMAQRNVGYIEATILARQGRMKEAEDYFSRLASRYPEDFMIVYSLGVSLMFQDKLSDAEVTLLKARELSPEYVNVYLSLAALYEKDGRLSQAYDMLLKVLSLGSEGSVADRARLRMYIIEGNLLMAEGNAAEALDVFDRARKQAPANVEVLFNIGLLYEQTSDWLGAVEVGEQFLKLNPNRPDVRLRLAKAYVSTQQYDLAANELQRVIDLAPNSSQADEARVQLQRLMASSVGQLIISGRRNDKILALQEHLSENPGDTKSLRLLVTLLLQQQRWLDARAPLERLLSVDPTLALTHTSLALVYEKLGLYELAIEPYSYGISLEANPDTAVKIVPSLSMVVAKALYTRGDLSSAESFFSEIILLQPANAEARFYVGLIYFSQDRIVEAIDAFQRVLQYDPSHIPARLNLAMSYHQLKREEEAIEEFRNALHFSPSGPLSDQIKGQMQDVEKSIRGFSGGISYVLVYDTNSNLNSDNPQPEYRTDLSPRLLYRYKAMSGLRWLLSTEPSYSSYHKGQFDFLNTRSSAIASVSKGRVTMSAGLSYQVSSGLVDAARSSNNTTYHGEWAGRFKLPVIIDPLGDARVLTNTSLRASYAEFDSLGSSFYSAYNYSAIASINQPIAERTVLSLSYRSSLSENMNVEGTDYAFRGNGVDVRLERGVAAGVSINGGYSLTRMDYLYPDSTTNFTRYRRNQSESVNVGVNYQFHRSLRLFVNVAWSGNQSNLPVGFILNAQDVVEGQQSPSLGDYSRISLTAGIALSL